MTNHTTLETVQEISDTRGQLRLVTGSARTMGDVMGMNREIHEPHVGTAPQRWNLARMGRAVLYGTAASYKSAVPSRITSKSAYFCHFLAQKSAHSVGFSVFKVGFFVIFEDRHFKFDQKYAFFVSRY